MGNRIAGLRRRKPVGSAVFRSAYKMALRVEINIFTKDGRRFRRVSAYGADLAHSHLDSSATPLDEPLHRQIAHSMTTKIWFPKLLLTGHVPLFSPY